MGGHDRRLVDQKSTQRRCEFAGQLTAPELFRDTAGQGHLIQLWVPHMPLTHMGYVNPWPSLYTG